MGSKLIKNLLITSITITALATTAVTTNHYGFNYIANNANKEIKNPHNSKELKEKWVEYKQSCLNKKDDAWSMILLGNVLYHSYIYPGRPS
jgi:hypothetical protein